MSIEQHLIDEPNAAYHSRKTMVMLDLETLGTRPGSAIVAVGAVKFSDGKILDEFLMYPSWESNTDAGLVFDVDTIRWWMVQPDDARSAITQAATSSITDTLIAFAAWINDYNAEVWGNGSDFDNVIMSEAYKVCGQSLPWKWRNNRCYRTAKAINKEITIEHIGTKHNALDDARSQAFHLMKILPQ